MSFSGKWSPVLLAAALFAAASGCSPMDQGPMDEEKEPHFVLGKSRVNAMNYSGAIEAFEESLEANPHSAQAHYQLAMLYENQESDPAAAIYHYQEFLKYDPKAENAEIIGQHISSCKQQLAADVLQLPSAPAAQQQLEKLTEENRRLHDQLSQWQAAYAMLQAAVKTNPPIAQNPNGVATPAQVTSRTTDDMAAATTSAVTKTPTIPHKPLPSKIYRPRTHSVVSGETLAGIARKQGVTLAAMEAANPGVNPKKLKAGQVLNLPAP
jgi:LysM repeat protein